MSMASYRRNKDRGVTGPQKPTCQPAAMEQLSPYSLPAWVYGEYNSYLSWYDRLTKRQKQTAQPETQEMLDLIFSKLGGFTCEDVAFRRANTAIGLKRIVHQLLSEDFQVIVDIDFIKCHDYGHSVGLVPTTEDDHFFLVSNQVPQNLGGTVTLDDLAPRLALWTDPPMRSYPFNNANITGIPPA